MENFRKLQVWEKAHQLAVEVYKSTNNFPKSELFSLVSQKRRAAVSVAANIVEGSKRKTIKDRQHFLLMAETSLEELKYYFILSFDLGYITREESERLLELAREVGRMLKGLSRSLDRL